MQQEEDGTYALKNKKITSIFAAAFLLLFAGGMVFLAIASEEEFYYVFAGIMGLIGALAVVGVVRDKPLVHVGRKGVYVKDYPANANWLPWSEVSEFVMLVKSTRRSNIFYVGVIAVNHDRVVSQYSRVARLALKYFKSDQGQVAAAFMSGRGDMDTVLIVEELNSLKKKFTT